MFSNKQEIWAIIKDVYGMSGEGPVSEKQVELVDYLDRYFRGTYKPEIKVVTVLEIGTETVPGVVQVKKGRGRPRKS